MVYPYMSSDFLQAVLLNTDGFLYNYVKDVRAWLKEFWGKGPSMRTVDTKLKGS